MRFIEKYLSTITLVMTAIAIILVTASIYLIFMVAPLEKVMGFPQKIFYYHVPIAITCYLSLFICFVASCMSLWKGNLKWDGVAASGAEIGVILATLMLISGMLWGKPVWGTYWTWDPRLTTSFILWLIFLSYFILRSQPNNEVLRAKYSAVIGIIGFVDVPLVHWSVKLWSRGIHPVIDIDRDSTGIHPEMLTALKVSFAAILVIFILIFSIRVRYSFLKSELQNGIEHSQVE